MLPNSLNLNKTANRAGIFHALGLSRADLSLSAWKSSNKTKFSLLKVLWGECRKPQSCLCALTPVLAALTGMQITTWALQLAGGCRRSSLLAGGCSWLSKWQQRVCLCLSLPVVSTLQDWVLKLKDVSNYKPCRGAGSWEAAGVQLSRGGSRGCWQPGTFPTFHLGWSLCGSGRRRQLCSHLASLCPRARLILCAFMDRENKLRSRVIRRWFCCWRSSFDSKPGCGGAE